MATKKSWSKQIMIMHPEDNVTVCIRELKEGEMLTVAHNADGDVLLPQIASETNTIETGDEDERDGGAAQHSGCGRHPWVPLQGNRRAGCNAPGDLGV